MRFTRQLCHTPAYPSYSWENPTPYHENHGVRGICMWVLGGRGRGLAFHTHGLPLAHPISDQQSMAIFLYQGYNYNKDDLWNGLFQSLLLVTVGFHTITLPLLCLYCTCRPSNTYSHHLVLWIKNPRQLSLEMPEFMV